VLERDGERTRLLSRWRFRRRGAAHTAFKWLAFDPAHFIMETGVLHGLKTRAERRFSTATDGAGRIAAQVAESSCVTDAEVGAEVRREGVTGGVR
jgi:hypothetical protein